MDSGSDRHGGHPAAVRGVLVAGFLALTVAVLVAHRTPAAGYELDIYAATPLAVWVGVCLSLGLAVLVAVFSRDRLARWLALVLASGAIVAVSALPLLRNYFFYGFGDSLTHLGWARDIAAGELGTFELFYPGLHTASIIVSHLTATALPRAMLLIVLCFLFVYLLFIPLCVRELTGRSDALVVGCFAALLVLPVNHIAFSYMDPHPISEAILVSPLTLYLLLRYLNGDVGPTRFEVSLVGGLLALALVAILIYHTMQAANLLSILVGIGLLQLVVGRYTSIAVGKRTVYAHTAFFVGAFALWNVQFSVVTSTAEAVVRSLVGMFVGSSSAGAVVSSRSSSLSGLGASLSEIFLKLFFPSTIFALLTAVIVLYSIYRWRDDSLAGVRVLGAGLVGLTVYSVPFVAGNVSKLLFRNLGFVMVIGTILGSATLLLLAAPNRPLQRAGVIRRSALTALLAALLAVSLLIIFPSPFIYNANGGVSATEYQGYETAFEQRDPDVAFAGIRDGPQRLVQAIYGRSNVPEDLSNWGFYRTQGAIRGENLTRLSAVVEQPRYLIVTRKSKLREIEAYRELRYNETQFASVTRQPEVNRVFTNGPFTLYHITPAEAANNATGR